MNNATINSDPRVIGSFEQNEAFAVARTLEHAGINAVLAVDLTPTKAVRGFSTAKYQITVSASNYSRAVLLV